MPARLHCPHIVHVFNVVALGRRGTVKVSYPASSGNVTTSDPSPGEDDESV